MLGEERWPARNDVLWLAGLSAVRAAVPLIALAFGGALPGFPSYSYQGPRGDASGYIATARAIISAGAGLRLLLPVLLAVGVAGVVGARWAWRRYPDSRHWVIAGSAALASCLLAAVILNIEGQAPAGAVGWPLLLGLALVPFRVVGWIDNEVAVGVGIAIAIVANAVTIFATAFIGQRVTGSRRIGILAAALFTFWPFLTWLLLGERTWGNSAWEIDAGLELYTEPVSTACVATGIALALVRRRPPWAVVTAGDRLRLRDRGSADEYRLRGRRRDPVRVGARLAQRDAIRRRRARSAADHAGVPAQEARLRPRARARPDGLPLWSNDYLVSTFTDSSVYRPLLLALLLPVVVVGVLALPSRRIALMLLGGALANALIYSFFRATFEHPRYLQAGLPALLVLWAAGAFRLAEHARRTARPAHVRSS